VADDVARRELRLLVRAWTEARAFRELAVVLRGFVIDVATNRQREFGSAKEMHSAIDDLLAEAGMNEPSGGRSER
jgi:hypothetical protein